MYPARLADLLLGLSAVADLGFALPAGSASRSCALAVRLARELDLPDDDVRAAFYTALLHHIGCIGFAQETATLFGDELAVNRAAGRTDAASGRDVLATFLPTLTRARPPLQRVGLTLAVVTRGGRWGRGFTATACEIGRDTARRLSLPADVQASLFHVYDLWRGNSGPRGLNGDDIPVAARIARLTAVAVLFESLGGPDLAARALQRRAGGMLDPGLLAAFAVHAPEWFAELEAGDPRSAVLDAEPLPHQTARDLQLVAAVFGDLVDLKSPYLLGHSRGVADLAQGAGRHLRLAETTTADLGVAGLLHDVGRVAVSTAVWDKPGRLGHDEWEQVRLHPYHSERILAGSGALARLAPLVGRHHERLDGSGYHRGSTGADLSEAARVLAAADAYRTATEPRPHRPALAPDRAERRLLGLAADGALDQEATRAVLAAAGRRVVRGGPSRPGGLSEREVEVLRLVAQGCSNQEIAARLVISRRTAEHHVQHIYTKIGVSGRAAATLFAAEHHLLAGNG